MVRMAAPGCELRVRVLSRRLVTAASESESECKSEHQLNHRQPPVGDDDDDVRVITVSNLDLIPNTYQASVICIYPKPPAGGGDFDAVVAAFEAGLPSLLRHFFPLTGRIVGNPESGLPEVHCRNQGAELVVAQAAGVPLRSLDWGLAEESLKRILLPYAEDIPLSVQLVSFACGGFAVTWSLNNLVLDGNGATRLVRAWSELARSGTGTMAGRPSYDHRSVPVFRARDPPSYGAAVEEMFVPYDDRHLVNVLTAQDSFVERLYYVDAADIARLQEMATETGRKRPSRVQAVSAYLWKRLAGVVAASTRVSAGETCCMGYWVDGRWRVTSPALREALRDYVGNVTTYVLGEAAVEEVRRKSLAEVAAMVREAIASVDYDERLQELVDWVEVHKTQAQKARVVERASVGLGGPTISQTVWASFPLDTDFGFGHAAMAMPTWPSERLCSGSLAVAAHPGGTGSWLVSAYVWPSLIRALESDDHRIFKPLTADHLGL